eukprot:5016883-Pyramimonas_sp.AAC.1
MNLIPKPDGGERTVALFTTCVRTCSRFFRHTYGAMWARLHPRPYVYGVRGHSCQACVWRMGVLT